MLITKKHLPRRTFLRGMGVTLALPLLDSMVPAQTLTRNTAAAPLPRLGFVYVPHGAIMAKWTPDTHAGHGRVRRRDSGPSGRDGHRTRQRSAFDGAGHRRPHRPHRRVRPR